MSALNRFNVSPKIRGPSPKLLPSEKCGSILHNTCDFDREYLQNDSRYPKSEYVIENDSSPVRRKKSGKLWSSIQKVGHVSLDPPKSTFFGRLYFCPYGMLAPQILHWLDIHQGLGE